MTDLIQRTGREIDFTRTYWGHNLQSINGKGDTAEFFVWCTPSPHEGDTMRWRTGYGEAVALVEKVEWTMNVDDMFKVSLRVIERIERP